MENTRYIVIFILVLTSLVAIVLTGLREVTKSGAELNEDIFNKRAILSAVEKYLTVDNAKNLTDEQVVEIFEQRVDQFTLNAEGTVLEDAAKAEDIDMAKERKKPVEERVFPLFVYKTDEGEKIYIVSVRGSGLWDEIWGNIALESDINTIAGAAFDHKAETPGLGAEIKDNPAFPRQFIGKEIFTESGEYVSVLVKKGGADDSNPHAVDAISGATVTSDGVTEMLERGIGYYLPYLQELRQPQESMLIQE